MANEVMQKLFGLSSQDAADSLRKQQMEEDYKYATLDPRQQIIFNARQAGRGIGRGLNQMFGLVPEQLQRVRGREGALQQVQQLIASGEITVDDPIAMTKALIAALTEHGQVNDAGVVMTEFQKNYPDYIKAQAAATRAAKSTENNTRVERDRALAAKVEEALSAGTPVAPEALSSAMNYYIGAATDTTRTGQDAFGNPVDYVAKGNPAFAGLYPNLAALLIATQSKTTVGDLQNPQEGSPAAALAPEAALAPAEAALAPAAAPALAPAAAPLDGQPLQPVNIPPSEAAVPPVPVAAPAAAVAPVVTPAARTAAPVTAPVVTPAAAAAAPVATQQPTVPATNDPEPAYPKKPERWDAQSVRTHADAVNAFTAAHAEWARRQVRGDKQAEQKSRDANTYIAQQHLALQQAKFKLDQTEKAEKEQTALKSTTVALSNVLHNLDNAEKLVAGAATHGKINTTTGLVGNLLSAIKMPSDARKAANAISAAVSEMTVQRLQEIRRSSSTGAALGNSSDRDVQLLRESVSVIDTSQDPVAVLNAIAQVKWLMNNYSLVANNKEPITTFIEPYQKVVKGGKAVPGSKYYIIDNMQLTAAQYWGEKLRRDKGAK